MSSNHQPLGARLISIVIGIVCAGEIVDAGMIILQADSGRTTGCCGVGHKNRKSTGEILWVSGDGTCVTVDDRVG